MFVICGSAVAAILTKLRALGARVVDVEAGHTDFLQPNKFVEEVGVGIGALVSWGAEALDIVVRRRILIDDRGTNGLYGIRRALFRSDLIKRFCAFGFRPDIVTYETGLRPCALDLARRIHETELSGPYFPYGDGRYGQPPSNPDKSKLCLFWQNGPSATLIETQYNLDKFAPTLAPPADMAVIVLPIRFQDAQHRMLDVFKAAGGDPERIALVFFREDGSMLFDGIWHTI